mmetsp:Transcript_64002/g.208841  ORF Transcript_64002/g.208841 Transcript_64002/m.208841 type:complete len:244 (-) Transcript_64002:980-1711(-)
MIAKNLCKEVRPSFLTTQSSWFPGTKKMAPNFFWSSSSDDSRVPSFVATSPARSSTVSGHSGSDLKCSMLAPMSECKSLHATTSRKAPGKCGHALSPTGQSKGRHLAMRSSLGRATAFSIKNGSRGLSGAAFLAAGPFFACLASGALYISCAPTEQPQRAQQASDMFMLRLTPSECNENALHPHSLQPQRGKPIRSSSYSSPSCHCAGMSQVIVSSQLLLAETSPVAPRVQKRNFTLLPGGSS